MIQIETLLEEFRSVDTALTNKGNHYGLQKCRENYSLKKVPEVRN